METKLSCNNKTNPQTTILIAATIDHNHPKWQFRSTVINVNYAPTSDATIEEALEDLRLLTPFLPSNENAPFGVLPISSLRIPIFVPLPKSSFSYSQGLSPHGWVKPVALSGSRV